MAAATWNNPRSLLCIANIIMVLQEVVAAGVQGTGLVGACYGTLGNNLPPPKEVVAMYQSHQLGRMRLYDPNLSILQALRHSGIQLVLGVRNQDLPQLATSYSSANAWVHKNIRAYWPDVIVRYISVGNEVIPGEYANYVLPAMKNIYQAIKAFGVSRRVKVSTSVPTSVLGMSYPPSTGSFSQASTTYMGPIVRFLVSTRAPLLVNVYPYFSYVANPRDISLSYATFTANKAVVIDGHYRYWNLFDATLDAFYAALEKAGGRNVEVVVSETGWPSAGDGHQANIHNAETYNTKLVKHVSSSKGTPRRPGRPIETYIFAMFNENLKTGSGVERNFGLFYPNKKPVYPLEF